MKKVKLTHIRLPESKSYLTWQKQYSFYLGNEVTITFRNKKKAHKFLADTNRFLNLTLQELNIIYSQIFTEYRRLWFVLDIEDNIDHQICDLNKLFRHCIKTAGYQNGNFFSFINIYKICNEMLLIINKLSDFVKSNNNFNDVNIFAVIKNRINSLLISVENWGKQETD